MSRTTFEVSYDFNQYSCQHYYVDLGVTRIWLEHIILNFVFVLILCIRFSFLTHCPEKAIRF